MTDHVKIRDFEKRFGKEIVLKNINLDVKKGELLGIIGPNGGGKSTLLKAMAGLLRPTGGQVFVSGKEAYRIAKESPGELGLVLPTPGFYPLLTGWENLIYFGNLFGLSEENIRNQSASLLKELKLEDMSKPLHTWSSGTQQKLSLVRALLLKPQLLLLDEPTANLDPLVADLFFSKIRELADSGTTCVLVTHRLWQAEKVCERVILVDREIKDEIEIKRDDESGKLLKHWKEREEENAS